MPEHFYYKDALNRTTSAVSYMYSPPTKSPRGHLALPTSNGNHRSHLIALDLGGTNFLDNLVYLFAQVNTSIMRNVEIKFKAFIFEWFSIYKRGYVVMKVDVFYVGNQVDYLVMSLAWVTDGRTYEYHSYTVRNVPNVKVGSVMSDEEIRFYCNASISYGKKKEIYNYLKNYFPLLPSLTTWRKYLRGESNNDLCRNAALYYINL